jgi:hypothetical protein
MDLLSTIDKDILSNDDRKEIKRHLLAMKCDPAKIGSFIWFLDRTELWQMKYATLPQYDGDLKRGVYRINTKTKGEWIVTREDIKDLLTSIGKLVARLTHFHMDDDFSLLPIYRNFYESGDFGNLGGATTDKVKVIYPLLVDLQPMLKKAIEFSAFTKRGRTPKEYRTDLAYHIVHHFYMSFERFPSATTRNSRFENIVEICYRALNIETTDLGKTISKAVLRYKEQLTH